jgi:hypothetical protein
MLIRQKLQAASAPIPKDLVAAPPSGKYPREPKRGCGEGNEIIAEKRQAGFVIPVSQPFANPALPCNPTSLSLLFALGRSPSNSLRHNGFQLGTGSTLPAFCQNHPANPQIAGRDRLATDCLLSQTVQSLRCHFRVFENRRHYGELGWCARVSAQQFPDFRLLSGGFVAPVSALDFPISVSAYRRPVR